MQMHQLKRKTDNKSKRMVGRGGKRGKTSGRGTKGQNARAGRKKRPEIRDIIKKLPKRRGFKFSSIALKPSVINLETIEKNYSVGEIVSPQTLLEKNLIKLRGGVLPKVKILGRGKLTKEVEIKDCLLSNSCKNFGKK